MLVEELIIDGFKSYATRTVISGWDPQFNAITGLNGSGKSNILDSICFVLGISSMSTVRASNLQDLIYKRGQAGVTKASVTIVFNNSDKKRSPIGFEQHSKISVTRQISLGQGTKYLINGHRAQQQQVLTLFQSVQLNINNPNFLIMQGKITKLLNMKPTEILSLIEEAAGTKMYEGQREKAEKTMSKKNLKLESTQALLEEEVEPKLEHLRNQKRVFLEYQDVQTELETLSKAVAAHDYKLYTSNVNEANSLLLEKQNRYESLENQLNRLNSEIENLEEDLVQMKERKQQESTRGDAVKQLESKENELTNEITRLTTSREFAIKNQQDIIKRNKKIELEITKLNKFLDDKKLSLIEIEKEYNESKTMLDDERHQLRRKEDLLSTLSTGISSKGSTDSGYMAHLQEARKRFLDTNVQMEKDKLKIQHLESEISSNVKKVKNCENELKSIENQIQRHKRQIEILEGKMNQIGFHPQRFQDLKIQEKELQQHYQRAYHQLQDFKRNNPNFEFYYEPPSANFNPNSVKGLAGELFSIPDSNLNSSTALEVCAGGRVFNIVVDTEVTGSQLLEKGRLRKRVTIIPLNKISVRRTSTQALNSAKRLCPNKVELALNLIEYGDDVEKAMEYIFGNRLICDDPETAKKVTFDPSVRTGSITLEGDSYDPEGRLSGGSRRASASLLMTFKEYTNLKRNVDDLQIQLKQVSTELQSLYQLSEKTKTFQHDLNMEKHQISLNEQQLENGPASTFLKKHESNLKEVESLREDIKKNESLLSNYQIEVSKIEKDMKEFDSDQGSKLKQLKNEVDQSKVNVQQLDQSLKQKQAKYQEFQIQNEQILGDLEELKSSIEESDSNSKNLTKEKDNVDIQIKNSELELLKIRNQLDEEKEKIASVNEELNELNVVLNKKKKLSTELGYEFTKAKDNYTSAKNIYHKSKNGLDQLIEEHEWVRDANILESVLEQYPNIDLNECHQRIQLLSTRLNNMKRKVNTNIMSAIEQHEKHEASLKHKIKTIQKDKSKIEETIQKLDDYKRTELIKTYKKVSNDFGQIFSDLLPGSYAKLVPSDQQDVTKGLEVKVKLGNVWKESLVELSGGQRSLVALSLIMSLLQFKPAPMYILDEVDAALDLSHTQNIGHLIKTRFKGSQFIVVSLKEGMFTNANRIFRTRFQDGTSVVTAT
ncbi:hypothetical protein BVG19_g4131 [[Candida] boidinii]|nr:hypothetical protein BVG19_g4131 [[Candida] boidinii]OWB51123.1 hypothetical protein B5S27_g2681 [[Candida] boidinii]